MTSTLGTVLMSDALYAARLRGASDIHLLPTLPPILRVDGRLQPWDGPGLSAGDMEALSERFLSPEERRLLERCGDVTTASMDAETPLRIHAARSAEGTTFTIRLLAREVPRLEDLALPPAVAEVTARSAGLVLIGGPTGSGKSTTLAAIIASVSDTSAKKIVTIEDPIEYRIRSGRSIVVQRQVGRDVTSFAQAVLGALRCDPDVIAIGELRDAPTVAAALTASETGHLVLATLHTGDAAQTVDRLVDAFPSERSDYVRARIAQVLALAVCQRLVERSNAPGRCLAAEVLVATDAVRHMIREGKQHQLASVMTTGRLSGMQTLEAHLGELVERSAITPAAAEAALR